MPRNQRHSVGIFSRDGQDNYKWLISLLRTVMFQSMVEVILPVYISNNARSFASGLSQSSFAIVYHTKKRGRLNIANVTDSLYDEELQDLSRHLGRSNVIVLVDDLEDSSDNNMRRILQEQRLDTFACKLILISEKEKESSNLSGADPRLSQSPTSVQMQDPYNSLYNKLLNLKDIIGDAPNNSAGLDQMNNSDISSDSSYDSRSKEDIGSGVTSTAGFRSHDDDSIQTSRLSGSGPHTRMVTPPGRTVTIDIRDIDQENLLDLNNPKNPTGTPVSNTDRVERHKDKGQRNRKKDKMVFGIILGLIVLLVIVLIIVLCVTL
ncbi:uncharacterized protein LOC142656710 [Rhinoderma darwinii]|uniref:uncharacterized protein LOC142656710 n=1 Tax=Rhinoderma darwinii TaxID=43563 RepID=UPI003F662EA8